MANIENIFKNQVYFKSINSSVDKYASYITKSLLYKTMLIKDPQSMCIDDSGDVYEKVKPFINYLVSNYTTMKPEGYRYINSLFEIGIFIRDNEDYKKLVKVDVDIYGDVFNFYEPEFI